MANPRENKGTEAKWKKLAKGQLPDTLPKAANSRERRRPKKERRPEGILRLKRRRSRGLTSDGRWRTLLKVERSRRRARRGVDKSKEVSTVKLNIGPDEDREGAEKKRSSQEEGEDLKERTCKRAKSRRTARGTQQKSREIKAWRRELARRLTSSLPAREALKGGDSPVSAKTPLLLALPERGDSPCKITQKGSIEERKELKERGKRRRAGVQGRLGPDSGGASEARDQRPARAAAAPPLQGRPPDQVRRAGLEGRSDAHTPGRQSRQSSAFAAAPRPDPLQQQGQARPVRVRRVKWLVAISIAPHSLHFQQSPRVGAWLCEIATTPVGKSDSRGLGAPQGVTSEVSESLGFDNTRGLGPLPVLTEHHRRSKKRGRVFAHSREDAEAPGIGHPESAVHPSKCRHALERELSARGSGPPDRATRHGPKNATDRSTRGMGPPDGAIRVRTREEEDIVAQAFGTRGLGAPVSAKPPARKPSASCKRRRIASAGDPHGRTRGLGILASAARSLGKGKEDACAEYTGGTDVLNGSTGGSAPLRVLLGSC